jgi:hypothetical protein
VRWPGEDARDDALQPCRVAEGRAAGAYSAKPHEPPSAPVAEHKSKLRYWPPLRPHSTTATTSSRPMAPILTLRLSTPAADPEQKPHAVPQYCIQPSCALAQAAIHTPTVVRTRGLFRADRDKKVYNRSVMICSSGLFTKPPMSVH